MPEGDSLHRIARRLQVLVGERVEAESPNPRGLATGVARAIDGRVLERVDAVGKNLLLRFDGNVVVRSHLRMTGRWRIRQRGGPPQRGAPWLVLRTSEWEASQWNGPVLALGAAPVRELGPDLLAPDTDTSAIVARLRRADPSRLVGEALVDQRLVAGIGNMWLAEMLWHARVSPWASVDRVLGREAFGRACLGHGGDDGVGRREDAVRARSIAAPVEAAHAAATSYARAVSATPTAGRTGAQPVSRSLESDASPYLRLFLGIDGEESRMRNEHEGGLTQGLIPVTDADQSQLADGIALCLSEGGYRAMLFHLGGIIRLNEMGQLKTIARVSSVSAGSITAGVLGQAWRRLDFSAGPVARNLDELRGRADSEDGREDDRQPGDHLGPAAAGSHDRADACELLRRVPLRREDVAGPP